MSLGLPHWTIGNALAPTGNDRHDREQAERWRQILENFEHLESQTETHMRNALVHDGEEALGTVTSSSTSYESLSGGPSITVRCRPGLMIAVLMDVELKNTDPGGLGEEAGVAANLDGGASVYVAEATVAHAAYTRILVPEGSNYPAGLLALFPATSTSHTVEMKYKTVLGTGVASFKNRRIWAWVL